SRGRPGAPKPKPLRYNCGVGGDCHMSKRSPSPTDPLPSILARALVNGRKMMSPVAAREFLKFGFSKADQNRIADLVARNQAGTLSPAEKAELFEYVDASHILSTLHSLAHLALRQSRAAKA